MKTYYVYIMINQSRTLYVGMTNDLARRIAEHREGLNRGFTQKYDINRLVHFETVARARDAIEREKQIKGWRREKKIALIDQMNPHWDDLSVTW